MLLNLLILLKILFSSLGGMSEIIPMEILHHHATIFEKVEDKKLSCENGKINEATWKYYYGGQITCIMISTQQTNSLERCQRF